MVLPSAADQSAALLVPVGDLVVAPEAKAQDAMTEHVEVALVIPPLHEGPLGGLDGPAVRENRDSRLIDRKRHLPTGRPALLREHHRSGHSSEVAFCALDHMTERPELDPEKLSYRTCQWIVHERASPCQ